VELGKPITSQCTKVARYMLCCYFNAAVMIYMPTVRLKFEISDSTVEIYI